MRNLLDLLLLLFLLFLLLINILNLALLSILLLFLILIIRNFLLSCFLSPQGDGVTDELRVLLDQILEAALLKIFQLRVNSSMMSSINTGRICNHIITPNKRAYY